MQCGQDPEDAVSTSATVTHPNQEADMLRVYEQREPEPTGQVFRSFDRDNGETTQFKWYRAVLVEIGFVQTWDEAKRLTKHPIVEEIHETVQ